LPWRICKPISDFRTEISKYCTRVPAKHSMILELLYNRNIALEYLQTILNSDFRTEISKYCIVVPSKHSVILELKFKKDRK